MKAQKPISRSISLAAAVVYAIVYDYVYHKFVYGVFGYMGVSYEPMEMWPFIAYVLMASLPMLLYKGFKNVATLVSFVTYMFIYVPFINAVFTTPELTTSIYYSLSCVLFVGMCLFFATDDAHYMKNVFLQTRKVISFRTFEIIAVCWLLLIMVLNSRSITFVNIFDDPTGIYELRYENAEASSSFEKYLFTLFEKAVLPVLLLVYLNNKQRTKAIIASLVFILCFSMDLQKITFFMPFLCIGLYFWMKSSAYKVYKSFHLLVFAIMIIFPLYLLENLYSSLNFTLAAFLIMRTQCVGGWLANMYLTFFEDNPFTLYTHINFIGKLTGAYPYGEEPLGRAVSEGSMNANANFWITDGYAALGVAGVAIMIAIFILFKGVLNSISLRYKKVAVVSMLFAVSGFLNVSLFTALITCGFALIYLIFLLVDLPSLSKERNKTYQ